MEYKEITITGITPEVGELLIALLSGEGFEGFEEKDDRLIAYIPSVDFDEPLLAQLLEPWEARFTSRSIPKTNWNQTWEENFQPVVVSGFCTIRADFHQMEVTTHHEVIITPKMSFGTGHHATTQLMIQAMSRLDFAGKTVYDFGTGTGILAILASKLGARKVVAVDNEDWAFENAIENAARNGTENIDVKLGSMDSFPYERCDIFLANINRHILLQHMEEIVLRVIKGGVVLMSGLLAEDKAVVRDQAQRCGFTLLREDNLDNWSLLCFRYN